MSEISFLQLHGHKDAVHRHRSRRHHHHHHRLTQVADSPPYWVHPDDLDPDNFETEFPAPADVLLPGSIVSADGLDAVDRPSFVMDLFQQRVEQSQVTSHDNIGNNHLESESGFGVMQGDSEIGVDSSELDLGLGLEFGGSDGNNGGFGVDNISDSDIDASVDVNLNDYDYHEDDGLLVGRRVSGLEFPEAASFRNEIRSVGIGLDTNDDERDRENLNERDRWAADLDVDAEYVNEDGDDYDDDDASVNIPLCWDSLQIEDWRETNDDFEWEEVDDRVVDEREVASVSAEAEGDDMNSISVSVSPIITLEELAGGEGPSGLGNLGWEVLLNSRNFQTNPLMGNNLEPRFGDHDDYIHTTEYEMLFEQFAEAEISTISRPPASKSFVKNLQSVVVTREDVEKSDVLCAVCKDEMNVGDKAAQLGCTHRYHRECIVPWLGIRNTCPVCRYELPTDDAEYERRKKQRASRGT